MDQRGYSPAPFVDVKLEGEFWRERLETVLSRTIPSQHVKLGESDILASLKLPQPPPPLRYPRNSHGFTVQVFWDSDVGKWVEAAAYALSHRRDPDIEAKIDAIVDDLAKAQRPDGYLNCWYNGREPDKRWTNLRDNHELYNCGHLLEGAIAYFQITGRRRFLDIMERYLDHIAATFGTGPGQKRGYPGHQEIELALYKLYRLTGDKRRLDLATYFINERGRQPHYFTQEAIARGDDPAKFHHLTYEYSQSHIPVREQTKVVGHAVRAMYMLAGMADLAAELNDDGLKRACETLWKDVTTAQMYVTAGLGPEKSNEGFTEAYDLPNETAYAETCASVALIFWAHRMLHLDLDGQYGDVMERALYNGALVGLSREGTHYFYANPLESRGQHSRWAWHVCPCCTMNVSRLVASVSGYFISTKPDSVAFHLYGGISTEVTLGGVKVALRETSDYPWDGAVKIAVDPASPAKFSVALRIPDWAKGASFEGQRRRRPAQRHQGLCLHRTDVASGRRHCPRSADAGRAHIRAPESADGRWPGRAAARAVGLLLRGSRQSRGGGAALPVAAQRCDQRQEVRQGVWRGDADGAGVALVGGRRPALHDGAAARRTRRAHRHSLLPLEQPRRRFDVGVAARGGRALSRDARTLLKPLDPGRVDLRRPFADGFAGDPPRRRDVRERQQDEGALQHAGVGQGEARRVEREIVISQHVDVHGARAPALLGGAIAAKRGFNFQRPPQQSLGRKGRRDFQSEVDKRRLVRDAPGRRAVVGGAGDELHVGAVAKSVDRARERRPAHRPHCRRGPQARTAFSQRVRRRVSVTPTSAKVAGTGACGLCTVTRNSLTAGNSANNASVTNPAAASTSLHAFAVNALEAISATVP